MAIRSKSKRKKGPQAPEKYPIPVGDNYQYWGEQPGFVYDPWKDQYLPDPRQQKDYAEKTGFAKKEVKPPGMWEQSAAAIIPPLVSNLGLLGLKYYLDKPVTESILSGIGPVASGDAYGQMLQNAYGSGGAGGLVGVGDTAPTPSFDMSTSTPELSGIGPVASGDEYGDMLNDSSWLNDLYQGSWLQSGVNSLGGLLGLV